MDLSKRTPSPECPKCGNTDTIMMWRLHEDDGWYGEWHCDMCGYDWKIKEKPASKSLK